MKQRSDMQAIDIAQLAKDLRYDPDTGEFTSLKSGRRVGSIDRTRGYVQVWWRGQNRYAHRLAWILMNGCEPIGIDHIDGNRSNNAWKNLREATQSENLQNQSAIRDGGRLLGAYFHSTHKRWSARIKVNGRERFLGNFQTQEEAHAAYCHAKSELHSFSPAPRKA